MDIRLDALTLEDIELVRQWRNADLASFRTPFPLTPEMQADFYRNTVCNRQSLHRYWAIRADAPPLVYDCALAGMGGLTFIGWENGIAEIALLIRPEARGHGAGIQAVLALLDEGFGNMGLETIIGEVYRCNGGGLRFWQEALKPYQPDWAVLPRRKRWQGRLWDADYFTVTAEAWRAPSRASS